VGCVRGALLLLPFLVSCGAQVNFLDPAGPRFQGNYAPPPPDSAPSELRVVTFNIKYSAHVDRAIEVLRESDSLEGADIVALQEMNDAAADSIARALRMNYAYLPSSISAITDTFFGPAVLSRWPIDSAWKLLLPHGSVWRDQRRTVTAAIVRVGGTRVRVYSIHLETQASIAPDEREDQAEVILDDAARADEPVILAGDLNSYGIGEYFARRGFQWLTQYFGETILLWSWDHLLVRGFGRDAVRSVGVERNARGASDHRPVWAVIGLEGLRGEGALGPSAPPPICARRLSRRRKNATSASP
jgi:endonuclease/exonuclease/phosphatase family metal-dependent hydrolase